MRSDRSSYELVFPPDGDTGDSVVVHPTGAIGPSGNPVYRDDSGIIQAEINDLGEVRMLPTSAHQHPVRPVRCRRVMIG